MKDHHQLPIARAALIAVGITDHAPRFSTLTAAIRAGLYGMDKPHVQHLVWRNINVDSERQLAALGSKKERAA